MLRTTGPQFIKKQIQSENKGQKSDQWLGAPGFGVGSGDHAVDHPIKTSEDK